MAGCIPALTIDGFITNKRLMITKIWEYFLASEYSQSNIFHGDITSFKYIMATSTPGRDLINTLESELTKLFNRYYDVVHVDVLINEDIDTGTQRVSMAVTIKEDGKTYHLSNEIAYTNGKIENFENKIDELYDMYLGQ